MSIRIRSDESHCKPGFSQLDVEDALSNMFESKGPVLRISRSFEGHCALTNADEANEVQQKCGNCEEGKKAKHESNITSFQVNNPIL